MWSKKRILLTDDVGSLKGVIVGCRVGWDGGEIMTEYMEYRIQTTQGVLDLSEYLLDKFNQ